ncbi:MAG: GFA family protein [Proteobacteria bacterium]|nr:GFA family protein [Pseudomonadota bacterium]
MKMPALPIEGGCRCGRVRFRISAPPLMAMACHCIGCQKMSGSAFSTSLAVPEAGFAVIAGETVVGGMHDYPHHQHCDWCKSWVFTRLKPAAGFINVRATMLDDARWFAPLIESYTSEALPWAGTGAKYSFAQFPASDEYPALIAEYQASQPSIPA